MLAALRRKLTYACKLLCVVLRTSWNTRPHFNPVFKHVEYTSNMAASYNNGVNDVISPHVFVSTSIPAHTGSPSKLTECELNHEQIIKTEKHNLPASQGRSNTFRNSKHC